MKFAVIGLGHWGPNHVRVLNGLPGCRVVAAADADPKRLEKAAQIAPGIATFTSSDELLALREIDAVVVATPVETHSAIVEAALRAGKDVLCEKPLCRDARKARELGALAKEKGRILMTGHIFLFNAGLRRLKQMLDSGELGAPYYIASSRTNLGPVRRDVNVAYDLASHDISIFNWLFGAAPEEVKAMGASFLQPGVQDVVAITLRYPGNILATVHCSWLDPKKVRQMTLVGSARMATWDDMNLTSPIAVYEKGAKADLDVSDYGEFLRVTMWEGDIRLPKIDQGEPLRAQAEYFAEAVRSRQLGLCGPDFSASVVEALEKVDACLNGGAR